MMNKMNDQKHYSNFKMNIEHILTFKNAKELFIYYGKNYL